LDKTEAPVISCYLNMQDGVSGVRRLNERAKNIKSTLSGANLKYFWEAMARIESFIAGELNLSAKGVAIFARGGQQPFFLPLQFEVAVPDWVVLDSMPNVYHLVELKDTYHRYVVLISTVEYARILEINLGAVTEQVWREHPELQAEVGTGWTKEHYHHHRQQQTEKFIEEKIKILDRLMSAGGHSHLILAGNPKMMARVRQALPKHLEAKLIDVVPAASRDQTSDVVAATIASFIEREQAEALQTVESLQREIDTNGLAVIGQEEILKALEWGQGDILILSKDYEPEDVREEMVRLAELSGCTVEIVEHSDPLMMMGGAGCLLRYKV
ncbi:hypothetical protein MJD09_18905, partial [bacterium]|nr:hypothetical protein [bacterium]